MKYVITDYGVQNCDRVQTKEIQAVIDLAFKNGGGTVVVPKGVFLTATLRLRSNITLYLESGAVIKGSSNPDDYCEWLNDTLEPIDMNEYEGRRSVNPVTRWHNGLIKALHAENVSIIGEPGSFFDGSNVFDEVGEENYRGPHGSAMHTCKNLYFEGYTVIHSGNWAHNIQFSENLHFKNVTVYAGHDGIDTFACDNVLIENCEFRTGDDCIAGYDNKDVVVRNCIFDSACSALRYGGTDVLVENCQGFAPARYGFRGELTKEEKAKSALTGEHCRHTMHTVFQYYCDYRIPTLRHAPGNIVIRNCDFVNPNALMMHPFDGAHVWCDNRPLDSITYENCKILGLSLTADLVTNTEFPLTFKLKNVTISSREEGAQFPMINAKNCKLIELENVTIEGFKTPTIVTDNPDCIKTINSTEIDVIKA